MKAFLYRVCAIFFSHFVLYPDYRISFFIPLAFRFADYNSFVNYDLPLKKVFNKISFLARYDMMTDHSNGTIDETTKTLIINDYARHRVTGGITLSLSKAFIADLRLNFEKYFYKKSGIPKESERDKIVIEFMTRF